MSTWEDEFDEALLESPWHSLPTSPTCVVKYAQHPHRPGYIILLTDLTGVYVESLLAPGIPSRMNEIKRTFKKRHQSAGSEDNEDVIAQSEAALARLQDFFGDAGSLKEAEAEWELRNHDYHDKVLSLHAHDWDWLFNLTELKGREPLQIISSQLISPLAEALAKAHEVDLPKGTKKKPPLPLEVLGAVLANDDIRGVLYPKAAGSSMKKTKSSPVKQKKEKTPEVEEENEEEEGGDEEEYRSSPEPAQPTEKKVALNTRGKRKVNEDDDDSPSQSKGSPVPPPEATTSASASASTSPAPLARSSKAKRKITSDDDDNDGASSSALPSRSTSPQKRKTGMSGRKKDPELDEANLLPPTQSSQKSKREREAEEEEELDRKLSEMKRKMGAGGGGRLGKRRMAR